MKLLEKVNFYAQKWLGKLTSSQTFRMGLRKYILQAKKIDLYFM